MGLLFLLLGRSKQLTIVAAAAAAAGCCTFGLLSPFVAPLLLQCLLTAAEMEAMHAAAAAAAVAVAFSSLGVSICCSWWQQFLVVYLGIGLLSSLYAAAALRWVRAAAAGWRHLTKEQQRHYGAFERYDWNSLATHKILLGAFFLVSYRLGLRV